MAQIIIDTEKDDERVLRAAVAFCNSITGDDQQLQVSGTVEDFTPILHHGASMAMGTASAFEDTEAPEAQSKSDGNDGYTNFEAPEHLGGQPGSNAGTPVVEEPAPAPEQPAATGEGLDADGLPWDKRIHSSSKKKVADGTWRKRKKPKDTDEVAWDAYVSEVEAELRQAGTGEPIPAPAPAPQPEAPATAPDAASAFGQQPAPAPAPQPEAPAPAPAPTTSGTASTRALADVMQLVTGNPTVLNGDVVNEVLGSNGIASLGLVSAAEEQRPGIIDTIYNQFEAKLNG